MGCNPSTEQVQIACQLPLAPLAPSGCPQEAPHPSSELATPQNPIVPSQAPGDGDAAAEANPQIVKSLDVKEKSQLQENDAQKWVDEMFETYDVNKRGRLNIVEFGHLLKEEVHPDISQEGIKQFFGIADQSGDKKIDKQELLAFYRTLNKN